MLPFFVNYCQMHWNKIKTNSNVVVEEVVVAVTMEDIQTTMVKHPKDELEETLKCK